MKADGCIFHSEGNSWDFTDKVESTLACHTQAKNNSATYEFNFRDPIECGNASNVGSCMKSQDDGKYYPIAWDLKRDRDSARGFRVEQRFPRRTTVSSYILTVLIYLIAPMFLPPILK